MKIKKLERKRAKLKKRFGDLEEIAKANILKHREGLEYYNKADASPEERKIGEVENKLRREAKLLDYLRYDVPQKNEADYLKKLSNANKAYMEKKASLMNEGARTEKPASTTLANNFSNPVKAVFSLISGTGKATMSSKTQFVEDSSGTNSNPTTNNKIDSPQPISSELREKLVKTMANAQSLSEETTLYGNNPFPDDLTNTQPFPGTSKPKNQKEGGLQQGTGKFAKDHNLMNTTKQPSDKPLGKNRLPKL